jgi:hypothetical protein
MPGCQSALLVTSRVSLMISGVGAVVYEVNVDPSDNNTFCGKIWGKGAGRPGAFLRCDLKAHGL